MLSWLCCNSRTLRFDFVVKIWKDGCAIHQVMTGKTSRELYTSVELCQDDSALSDNCLKLSRWEKLFLMFFFLCPTRALFSIEAYPCGFSFVYLSPLFARLTAITNTSNVCEDREEKKWRKTLWKLKRFLACQKVSSVDFEMLTKKEQKMKAKIAFFMTFFVFTFLDLAVNVKQRSRYKLMKEEDKNKKGLMVANINHLFTFQSAEIFS